MPFIDSKTNGDCDFNGWKCNSTDSCLEYSEQCDGECYTGLNKCGDKCVVPLTPGASSYEYVCQDQCIDNTVTCNGTCPDSNPVQCGKSCLTNITASYYKDCNGECILKGRYDRYWRHCESTGKCIRKFEQCEDGTCAEGRTKCGDDKCLCNGTDNDTFCAGGYNTNNWRECDGTCLQNRDSCNKTCVSGYKFCEEYKDRGNGYQYNRTRCIEESRFDENFKYCNECSIANYCVNNRDGCPSEHGLPCTSETTSTLFTSMTTSAPATPNLVTGRPRRRSFYH